MRSFAIIPAAGHSRRMGQGKLLLPFAGSTIFEQVLATWLASPVSEVVVVIRRSQTDLLRMCAAAGVQTISPATDPEEMKVSIQCGLSYLAERFAPDESDVWLMAPADCPRLSSAVIESLLSAWDSANPAIVLPMHAGRRGHPVLFPWPLAAEVARLGPDQGVNALFGQHRLCEVPCQDAAILEDVDTPDDYRRLLRTDAKSGS